MKTSSIKTFFLIVFAISLAISACKKNEYFIDGGLSMQSEAEMKMSTYDFLASRPNHTFDSLIKIINLTNTKALINQDNITFYAVPNEAVMRFQRRFTPSDKQAPRPLVKISVDTLKMLLNRLIIPGYRITLEQAVADKLRTYKDNNGDSINVYGKGGGVKPGSAVQTSAYYIEYQHRKIKNIDSVNYTGSIQTHNLITANARIHVLSPGANFGLGLKQKYYREKDN